MNDINLWAVLVAAFVPMALGMIWYSPKVFGSAWFKALGKDPNNADQMDSMKKGASKAMSVSFIMSLIMSYVLAWFLQTLEVQAIGDGVLVAFLLSLGFIVTTLVMNIMYEQKGKNLLYINGIYQILNLILMAMILVSWR